MRALAILVSLLCAAPAAAADPPAPAALEGVTVVEKLGARVPPGLEFADQAGRRVRLAEYLDRGRPILLTLGYYRCPMLCPLVMSGVARALAATGWRAGRDFDALTASIDPREGPAEAAEKRRGFAQSIGLAEGDPAWPFLTGPADSIAALAEAVGFRYKQDPESGEYAHTAAIFVLTPAGTVSRYLYGVTFAPRDLRFALVEAAAGRAGPTLDRVLFQCFRYNPASRRYELFIARWFRIGGSIVLVAVAALLWGLWRRESTRSPAAR